MAEKKKKKKDSQPKVPSYQNFDVGSLQQPWEDFYKPMDAGQFAAMNQAIMDQQIAYAPQLIGIQKDAQTTLFNNMQKLARENSWYNAQTENQLLNQYSPEFRDTYSALGKNINQGLSSGYELGEGLSKEIEQGIRGAQMARGNWLGPAPTAQEAFGKGEAAINLYNTRIGQAQNYLQGKSPVDMMAQVGSATGMGAQYYPSQSYVDSGLGTNVFGSIGSQQGNYNSALGSAQGAYNNALLGANDQNNNWMYQNYDRTADAWSYREAARQGLYSTPQVGGGGGMGGMGSMIGGVAGGVGTAVSGLAAAGVIGGGAAAVGAGGAAAAASAAASALCWLARKLLPTKWKAYRRWLFTEASPEFRRKYTFNARRLANALP